MAITTKDINPTIEREALRQIFPPSSGNAELGSDALKAALSEYRKSIGISTPAHGFNDSAQISALVAKMNKSFSHIMGVRAKVEEIVQLKLELIKELDALAGKQKRPLSQDELEFRNWQLDDINRLKAEFLEKSGQERDYYFAIRGEQLREFGKQIRSGRIVHTPYVEDRIDKILERLNRQEIVLLHGDTGGGKTECARIAAERYSGKPPIVVRGYPGMGQEELYGHLTLNADQVKKVGETLARIDSEIEAFKISHPDTAADDLARKASLITELILHENKVTVVSYILGARYLAMKEGRVLIEDESNSIPQGLRRKGNDLDTKRPGDTVTVQEDGGMSFIVAKGYGKIETANLGNRYGEGGGGRFKYGPDEMQRRSPVEFDYLPQETKGGIDQVKDPLQKQLFMIAIAALIDENGNISGPADTLQKIWNFSQYAAVTQLAFANRLNDTSMQFQQAGVPVRIDLDVLASPRMVQRILQAWKMDGFRYELDYYVAELLLAQATEPRQRAYLYQLGTNYNLFKSQGWIVNPDYGANGEVPAFRVDAPKNRIGKAELISFADVAQSIWGDAPARSVWPTDNTSTIDEKDRVRIRAGVEAMNERLIKLRRTLGVLEDRVTKKAPSKKKR